MLVRRKQGGISQGKLGAVLSIFGGVGTLAATGQVWLDTGEVNWEQMGVGWAAITLGWSLWGTRRAIE